ncbi:MAG: dTDP-glucose 4,6-dehydratase [Anaerolineae bacterium]|nr:dTDP-glucose 4,6-dehydratase [Anaerolineae bacterium]NIN95456.1 dTDP-glucose 4,6-dehydratase [Anaerolineae bacterium]NIQ78431.1 dTDP-glucose 4,6-dehydratase [Anaerolineae bacterium]
MKNLLITGGAGFIGSNFVHHILDKYADYSVVVYDKLTYAGNLDNLQDVADDPHYSFVKGDICDTELVYQVVQEHKIDGIVNFAAETHVDRSILEAGSFIQTDVYGTHVLLEAVRNFGLERIVHVSTDEVYGSVVEGSSTETDSLLPNSPYSASKAGGDLMCRAYHVTYGVPVIITRAANNFGPYQYPEKVIPLFITNALDNKPLPLYGDGLNVRDWLYVLDHCEAIDLMLHQGQDGEIYNVGSDTELTNLEMTETILKLMGKQKNLIQFVEDRPGHDRRYSLDSSKIHGLGWRARHEFEDALDRTVRWYRENRWWWEKIKSGEYTSYYEQQYGTRRVLSGPAA